MDFPIISYRDPLVSILILLSIVFVVSYSNYLWSKYKKKDESKKIEKFLQNFSIESENVNYKEVLQNNPDAFSSLMILASIFFRSGDYDEAISIYLVLLDNINDKDQKIDILTQLGKTYFRAGFLQRSRDILKEALSLKARNPEALKILLVVLEKTKEYKKAIDVIEALDELNENISSEKDFLKAFLIIEDIKLSTEQKIKELKNLMKKSYEISHIAIEFLLQNKDEEAWQIIEKSDISNFIDILWNLPEEKINLKSADNNQKLKELFGAKGYIENVKESNIFELDLLIKLKEHKNIADLSFEYTCKSCRHIYPIYFHRCPNCLKVNTALIEPVIAKKIDFNNFDDFM